MKPRIRKCPRPQSCEQEISYSPRRLGMNHTGIDMPGTTDYLAIYGPSEAADSGTITLPYTL